LPRPLAERFVSIRSIARAIRATRALLLAFIIGDASRQSGRKKMRKTILGLLGSSLIVASMASAVMAAEHHTRHHHPYVSESARHAFGSYHPNAFSPQDQNAFGTITPWEWTTGMQADDWRQSVNGR
jgi:hypothetical protein